MHVELVLRAPEAGRVHRESDLVVVGDAAPGGLPGEGPDPRAPRVLDAGDSGPGQGEPVNESARAPAHLDVADGDVVGRLPQTSRGPCTRARRRRRPRSAGQVPQYPGTERRPPGDDAPQDVAGPPPRRRAAREERRCDEDDTAASPPPPRLESRGPSRRRSASRRRGTGVACRWRYPPPPEPRVDAAPSAPRPMAAEGCDTRAACTAGSAIKTRTDIKRRISGRVTSASTRRRCFSEDRRHRRIGAAHPGQRAARDLLWIARTASSGLGVLLAVPLRVVFHEVDTPFPLIGWSPTMNRGPALGSLRLVERLVHLGDVVAR